MEIEQMKLKYDAADSLKLAKQRLSSFKMSKTFSTNWADAPLANSSNSPKHNARIPLSGKEYPYKY